MEVFAALAAVFLTAILRAILIKNHGQYLGIKKQKTRLKKGGQR